MNKFKENIKRVSFWSRNDPYPPFWAMKRIPSNKSYHFCQQKNLENRIGEVESGNPPSFLNVCNGVQFHNEKIY